MPNHITAPHTASNTVLSFMKPGDTVNLENDIVGKYVEKLLRSEPEPDRPEGGGLTMEFLAQNGF